jgi:LPS export ABC transporter protein LptC
MNSLKYIALFIGAMLVISCENDIEKVNIFIDKEKEPTVKVKNIESVYTENANPNMQLKAPSFERYEKTKSEESYSYFKEGIKILFFDEKKNVTSSMKSNLAKYLDKQKLWEARGKVEVVNVDGDVLNTELLYWDEEKEIIYSDEHVRIKTKDEILYGNGFESNQTFTKYRIKKLKGTVAL